MLTQVLSKTSAIGQADEPAINDAWAPRRDHGIALVLL